jgi:hypothetical protein
MSNYVWVTEMTDPSFHKKEVEDKIRTGEPVVLYTKAPIPPMWVQELHKWPNVAISFTITGWGSTWLEEGVPNPRTMVRHFNEVINTVGTSRIRLRIDPVIPTVEGMMRAGAVAMFIEKPVHITTSILQLYKGHEEMACRLRIDDSHYSVDSGRARYVNQDIAQRWLSQLYRVAPWTIGKVQFCGMPYTIAGTINHGCIDKTLLESIGAAVPIIEQGKQRPGCKCVVEKRQITMGKCEHKCMYCYAHKENLKSLKSPTFVNN